LCRTFPPPPPPGELAGHVLRCVLDQNGNHVVQKCIEPTGPPEGRERGGGAFLSLTGHPHRPSMDLHVVRLRDRKEWSLRLLSLFGPPEPFELFAPPLPRGLWEPKKAPGGEGGGTPDHTLPPTRNGGRGGGSDRTPSPPPCVPVKPCISPSPRGVGNLGWWVGSRALAARIPPQGVRFVVESFVGNVQVPPSSGTNQRLQPLFKALYREENVFPISKDKEKVPRLFLCNKNPLFPSFSSLSFVHSRS